MWADVTFDFRHFAPVERLALVGDTRWGAGMAAFCGPFTTAQVRYFDASQAAAAVWILEGVAGRFSRREFCG